AASLLKKLRWILTPLRLAQGRDTSEAQNDETCLFIISYLITNQALRETLNECGTVPLRT
ncbi:MAG: hypothetical protein ORN98_01690, partial [Alphaproteobacteria bacterium]|nr:hypothetical protein [Alphaproteobacteria bacterium]